MTNDINLDAIASENDPEDWEPFTFTFGGESYSLHGQMDMRVIAMAASGNLLGAMHLMMSPIEFTRLNMNPKRFSVEHFNGLITAYLNHRPRKRETTMGESSASTGSSKSTGRRSKPTSSGTTKSRSQGSGKRIGAPLPKAAPRKRAPKPATEE